MISIYHCLASNYLRSNKMHNRVPRSLQNIHIWKLTSLQLYINSHEQYLWRQLNWEHLKHLQGQGGPHFLAILYPPPAKHCLIHFGDKLQLCHKLHFITQSLGAWAWLWLCRHDNANLPLIMPQLFQIQMRSELPSITVSLKL